MCHNMGYILKNNSNHGFVIGLQSESAMIRHILKKNVRKKVSKLHNHATNVLLVWEKILLENIAEEIIVKSAIVLRLLK